MRPTGKHPMQGNVHVDGFVLGAREKEKAGRSYSAKKKKAITAIVTENGKAKKDVDNVY